MDESLEIIIPARNMVDHVTQCVSRLVPQLSAGDRVTVIDDASEDGTAQASAAVGACVIQLSRSRGPYFARQVAAARSRARYLIFIDARGRALPGLLEAHRRLLSGRSVALSCTNVRILAGKSFASRVAAESGLFDVETKVGVPGRLDFFPTCNLGVNREAFMAVGGFRQMRSGGDTDLCWRIQIAGCGRLSADTRVLLDWIPRDSLRALVEQSFRYGKSGALLEHLYPRERNDTLGGNVESRPVRTAHYLRQVARQSVQEPGLVANRVAGRSLALVQAVSHRRAAALRPESFVVPEPIPFEV